MRSSWTLGTMLAILALGAGLRGAGLGHAPPGLEQDEASNAWNAWCLLQTGHDQAGTPWPVFHTRGFGENRSTLFVYLLIPFQAIGGMNVFTTRLPSALAGVLTLLLIWAIGERWFGRPVGLVAALLMALNPWHIQQCRWGHEAAIVPLLVGLPVWLWLWAGLPMQPSSALSIRPWRAAVAALVTGVCCYGYPAVRLFLPLFLLTAVLVSGSAWRAMLAHGSGRRAAAAFVLGLGVTLGPLVWKHLQEPDIIGKRLAGTRVWDEGDAWPARLAKIAARYPLHFSPESLFFSGDLAGYRSPPDMGLFHAYMLLFMGAGAVLLLARARQSAPARVLLAWVVLYPAGDLLTSHGSIHSLRSLPGLGGLILLGAVGAVGAARGLYGRSRRLAWAAGAAVAVLAIWLNVLFLVRFYGEFNHRSWIRARFNVDLLAACDWLEPRIEGVDAVYVLVREQKMPYIITLVAMEHDPRRWFSEPREIVELPEWDLCVRYGKMHFLYEDLREPDLAPWRENGRPDRLLFIAPPGELPWGEPVHRVRGPDGRDTLWIWDQLM